MGIGAVPEHSYRHLRVKPKEIAMSKSDVYTRVTDRILSDLEQGVRTWLKPHTARAEYQPAAPQRHTLPRNQCSFALG